MRVKLNQLDLNEVHYFIRVVQEGSLSAASRYLQIPKSKISRKLAAFEKKVGYPLIMRNTRCLALTDEGRKIFDLVGGGLSDLIHQLDNSLSPQAELGGQLRIGMPSGLGTGSLMNIIGLFHKKYPGIRVRLKMTDVPEALLREDFDLVVNVGPVKLESLVAVNIAEMDLGIFASAEYLRKKGTPTSFEDLIENHLIIELNRQDFEPIEWPMTNLKGETYKLKIDSPLSVNLPEAVRSAILDHQGLGLLPWMLANPEWKDGKIVRVLPEWRVKEIPLQFLYQKHKIKNQKVKAFITFFKAEIARLQPRDK